MTSENVNNNLFVSRRKHFASPKKNHFAPGLHTTAREPKRAHSMVPAFNHTTKIRRNDPKRGRKSENCGGRGKKERNFGRSGGGGVRGSAQILDAPTKILNTHRTHHNTTQHNTTQQQRRIPCKVVLGKGGSLTGKSMAQKSRHVQQIVPKSSPVGQGFLGSRMVLKGLGTKRFDQKKKRAKRWSGLTVMHGLQDHQVWNRTTTDQHYKCLGMSPQLLVWLLFLENLGVQLSENGLDDDKGST